MAEAKMIVAGGVRYRAVDAEARGLKADTAAHAKKIAEGAVPVGTLAGKHAETKPAEAPAPISTAATGNTPKNDK